MFKKWMSECRTTQETMLKDTLVSVFCRESVKLPAEDKKTTPPKNTVHKSKMSNSTSKQNKGLGLKPAHL